ncbi:MAG: type II toxin-antitoxin system RatA family toxin [Gammaproteobacteria bacterium]
MREVKRSAIVPHSPQAMFDLVADVERYPEFVPGCVGAKLLSRDELELTGSLELSVGPLKSAFTTRNKLSPPHDMSLELLEGPFKSLQGDWHFEALGDAGCRIELSMRFAFSDPVKDMLLGPAFEQSCNRLVDAFVTRAAVIYE